MSANYQPLDKFTGPESGWDTIVIGSGIGGMSCAAALAKFGHRCLLLEQHYVPGGFTHTFSRKGYEWDVGVHCVGEMGPKQMPGEILRWLSDGKIQWQHMGPKYEKFFYPDGFEIDFAATQEEFRKTLEDKFPEDRESIAKYFETVRAAINDTRSFFAAKALPLWLVKLTDLFRKFRGRPNYFALTTKEVLEKIVSNPKLRTVLVSQWGYYGSTPEESAFAIQALITHHYRKGGYYPVGGSQTISEHLLDTIRSAGGETLVRASVREILLEGKKAVGVRMENGREFRARRVVSAAGARSTVENLLPKKARQAPWVKRISALHASPPHICLYLGIEGDIRAAGGTSANQWFMETWDMSIRDWDVNDPKSIAPVLYVSFPTLKDPQHEPGPQQRHTAEVVTFVPWSAFAKWKNTRRGMRDPEYIAFKKQLEERLLAQLRRHIPKILDITKFYEFSTPLSTAFFTRATEGAIYGLEATPARFACPDLRTRTPIKNLYLAGGDVATLGVTGALMGGILAAATLDSRVFAKTFTKPKQPPG